MHRRSFLTSSLALLGSALLSNCATGIALKRRSRIVIVGGGLSGLSIAWELQKLNYDVVILEATDRTGGRVLTQREGFLDGQFTEQGATLIPNNHELTMGYCKEFNLNLSPIPYQDLSTIFYFGGHKYVESPKNRAYYPKEWALTEEEDKEGIDFIESEYFHRGFSDIGNPRSPNWANQPGVKKLDALTYADYLRQKGASKTAIDIELAVEGSGGNRNSSAVWVAQAYLDRDLKTFYQISGGNDLLPQAFANRLQQNIITGAKVNAVTKENGINKVRYQKDGLTTEILADAVVFTVSPAILKKIEFSTLSSEKRNAINSVRMAPVTKASLAMKERFWQKEPADGLFVAYTDTNIERIWDISLNQKGKAGLLLAYYQEDHALEMSAHPEERLIQNSLAKMETFLPGSKKNFHKGSSFSWHHQDWVGGGWVSYTTNQLPLLTELGRSEDDYFFAGDHTSLRNAWMQGAFESALRVVSEISQRFPGYNNFP